MAIDMNVDVGEMIKGLFSKKTSQGEVIAPQNPYVKILISIVTVLILIASYIYFIYLPTQEELRINNEKLSQIEILRSEVTVLSDRIVKAKADLEASKIEYERRTTLFHTDQELEDLYGHISMLAVKNQLMVTKIEKGVENPILEVNISENQSSICDGSLSNTMNADDFTMQEESPQLKKVAYYEFLVDLEISGNYKNYTNFRNGLAKLKKIINIMRESIVVLESETRRGDVRVSSSIATYRLPANESEKCIQSEQGF
jgi:Tfp pilus assembly protein PilO